MPPEGNREIEQYQASAKLGSSSQVCTVKADVKPLGCKIENLAPAREYHIQVRGCLPSSVGCGAFVEKAVWTTPKSKFLLAFY